MKFLKDLQSQLEETYGAFTGLDVRDFLRSANDFDGLGEILVEQVGTDLNLAVIFDRDIFAAWENSQGVQGAPKNHRHVSVPFEEISHFVYLGFNHHRGRNITPLEMEIQGEIDRILLAFHGPIPIQTETRNRLWRELVEAPYSTNVDPRYEIARKAASAFLRGLSGGNPLAWNRQEFSKLCEYYHNDLQGKLRLSGLASS